MPRALVLDDSRAMRMILGRILREIGYDVVDAADGRQGLAILREEETLPDIALIDWNMPEMNGLEFVNAVRAEHAWRDMTLMMVTTESEHGQIVRALTAGAHEYVLKPFTNEAITEKLSLLGLVPAA